MKPDFHFTMHDNPVTFINDWYMGHNGTQSVVKIDGALVDPQFMRSCPVALVCNNAKQLEGIKSIILNASLITPTFSRGEL